MPHTNRHQQRTLPLRGGDSRTPEVKAEWNKLRARLVREIEEREGISEIKYWERRAWLYTR